MKSAWGRLAAVVLFLAVVFLVYEFSGLRDHFSRDYLQQQLIDHEVIGLMLFTLAFALGNLAQIPGWAFLAVAVLALGPTKGGAAIYIVASVSCAVTFGLIRLVGGNALREFDNATARRILSKLDSRPVLSVLLLRLIFQTLPALNYALAISGIAFRPYLYGTLLGLPIPIALYCAFFAGLSKAAGLS